MESTMEEEVLYQEMIKLTRAYTMKIVIFKTQQAFTVQWSDTHFDKLTKLLKELQTKISELLLSLNENKVEEVQRRHQFTSKIDRSSTDSGISQGSHASSHLIPDSERSSTASSQIPDSERLSVLSNQTQDSDRLSVASDQIPDSQRSSVASNQLPDSGRSSVASNQALYGADSPVVQSNPIRDSKGSPMPSIQITDAEKSSITMPSPIQKNIEPPSSESDSLHKEKTSMEPKPENYEDVDNIVKSSRQRQPSEHEDNTICRECQKAQRHLAKADISTSASNIICRICKSSSPVGSDSDSEKDIPIENVSASNKDVGVQTDDSFMENNQTDAGTVRLINMSTISEENTDVISNITPSDNMQLGAIESQGMAARYMNNNLEIEDERVELSGTTSGDKGETVV